MSASLRLLAAGILAAACVAAINWFGNIFVAYAIFAVCGLIAGLAWAHPLALLVPVAAGIGAAIVDIAADRTGFVPTRTMLVALWIASSLPGVLTALCAITLRRKHRHVLPPTTGGRT